MINTRTGVTALGFAAVAAVIAGVFAVVQANREDSEARLAEALSTQAKADAAAAIASAKGQAAVGIQEAKQKGWEGLFDWLGQATNTLGQIAGSAAKAII